MRTSHKRASNLLRFPTEYVPDPPPVIEEEDELEYIDLNRLLISRDGDTLMVDVAGDHEENGIRTGDKLLVRRGLTPGLTDLLIVEDGDEYHIAPYREINGRKIVGTISHILKALRGWDE
jgi:hypothetical protein